LSAKGSLSEKVGYLTRWLPRYAWQSCTSARTHGTVHLIFAMADHFEPAILHERGSERAGYDIQEERVERWCREYPAQMERWRDHDGRPFVHTYFYPAEQFRADRPEDGRLLDRLAAHCHAGWGEIGIHLHHGLGAPDSSENTRNELVQFRDALAERGCLSYWQASGQARYAFVHGNFSLANSAGGRFCGVDDELQVLSETGCYADFTLPTNPFNPAQTAKINSIYECSLPLRHRAAHRKGRDLERGRAPQIFPLIIQGPLGWDFDGASRSRLGRIENGALTAANPLSLRRLRHWKRAGISVNGRPDWLFIKLHCHGMDPAQREPAMGAPMQRFLRELVEGAGARQERLHFVTSREMVNIILAACDGREGNPRDYRDYRLNQFLNPPSEHAGFETSGANVTQVKG